MTKKSSSVAAELATEILADPRTRAKLGGLVRTALVKVLDAPDDPLRAIFAQSASLCGVTLDEVRGKSRHAAVVIARHLAWYAIRERFRWSYPQMEHRLGFDHTTILHACRSIKKKIENDPWVRTRAALLLREEDAAEGQTQDAD